MTLVGLFCNLNMKYYNNINGNIKEIVLTKKTISENWFHICLWG